MDDAKKKKSRAAYFRRWRKENPDKELAIKKRYILKKMATLGHIQTDKTQDEGRDISGHDE
jgi:hypothetical protein